MQHLASDLKLCVRVILLWGMAFIGLASATEPVQWPSQTQASLDATVSRVSDGDTVWLRTSTHTRIRARIIGIDAPESWHAGGREAKQALAERVLNQPVKVQVFGRDTYGRDLVVIWRDGQDVGARLVAEGLAWAYVWRGRPSIYESLERSARAQRVGIFASPRPEYPRTFRLRHGPC